MKSVSLSRAGIAFLLIASAGFGQNYFSENFNNNNAGWTLDTEWAIGPALASTGQVYGNPDPGFDADGVTGGGVAGVVIGGNASTALHGFYYLTSPIINIAGAPSAILNYARWLNSDYTPYMQNSIDVFNGVNWVNVWITGGSPGVQDMTWTCQSFDVTAHANASFQVRFGFTIGSAGVFTVSSWNVDNVSIDGTANPGCATPPPPPANDTCATAIFIAEGVPVTGQTNVNATTGPDPTGGCGGQSEDVWYVFVAGCSGTYTATTCQAGTTFDTALSVWDGSGGCGALVNLTCNDDGCATFNPLNSTATFTATAGTTYYISVGGYFGANGNFDLLVFPGGGMVLTFDTPALGCIGYTITGGPPNGTAFTAVSLTAGAYPNDWFFGIAITLQELANEVNTGFPFSVALNTCGSATVGPACGAPSGLTLYGVSLGIPSGGSWPTVNSPPATATIP
jgi:hypothetical protein